MRTGVAPDHQDMKKITNDYDEVFKNNQDRCKFIGNIWVGTDEGLPLEVLRNMYSGVILAYGSTSERELPIVEKLRESEAQSLTQIKSSR